MNPTSGFDRVANIGTVNGQVTRDYNQYLRLGGQNIDQPYSGSSGDSTSTIQNAIKLSQQAAQPGIDTLNKQQSTNSDLFSKQRTTLQSGIPMLQDRYKAVLDSIKGNQAVAENRQTATTAAELAKRGITTDSGVGAQEITNAVNPVTAQYAGMSADTGLQEGQAEVGQNNLVAGTYGDEANSGNAISQAIASLYGNAGNAGVSAGANIYGTNLNAQTQANSLALQRADLNATIQQNAIKNALEQAGIDVNKISAGAAATNASTGAANLAFQKSLNNPNDPTYGAQAYINNYGSRTSKPAIASYVQK